MTTDYTPENGSPAADHAARRVAGLASLYTAAAAEQLAHLESLTAHGVDLAPSTRLQLGYLEQQRNAHNETNGK